jgi:hypothetical protein
MMSLQVLIREGKLRWVYAGVPKPFLQWRRQLDPTRT